VGFIFLVAGIASCRTIDIAPHGTKAISKLQEQFQLVSKVRDVKSLVFRLREVN
jgi:hypothetical protein